MRRIEKRLLEPAALRDMIKDRKGCDLMRNEFTAIIERDGVWFIAYCPEIPGANGQGRTKKTCLKNLSDAIALILDDRRNDALRSVSPNAARELIAVG